MSLRCKYTNNEREIYKACFIIFRSEYSVYSRFASNIRITSEKFARYSYICRKV